MHCTTVATALSVSALALTGTAPAVTVWQIGRFDDSPAEFALWPAGARRFKMQFPQDPVFRIGRSKENEWPFIHPNSADVSWGREPLHRFTIKFHLDTVPEGDPVLVLGLYDLHERLPAVLHVAINGHEVFENRMPKGAGQAYYGRTRHQSHRVAVPLEGRLQAGDNALGLWLTDGSWIAYDALALYLLPPVGALPPRPEAKSADLDVAFLPLHPDSARFDSWRAQDCSCSLRDGWIVLTALGEPSHWRGPEVRDAMFDLEFDLYLPQSGVALAFAALHGYGPAWECRFASNTVELQGHRAALPGNGLIHVLVRNRPGHVTVHAGRGKQTVELDADRAPLHAGQFEFGAQAAGTRIAITNLHWTVPLAVAPVRRGARKLLRIAPVAGDGPGQLPPAHITVVTGDRTLYDSVRTLLCSASGESALLPVDLPRSATVKVGIKIPAASPVFTGTCVIEPDSSPPPVPDLPRTGVHGVERPDGLYAASSAWIVRCTPSTGPDLLINRESGEIWADGYLYRFADGAVSFDPPEMKKGPRQIALQIRGRQGPVSFVHTLVLEETTGRVTEKIESRNDGREPLDLSECRCGFVRTAMKRGIPDAAWIDRQFIAAPLIHDPLEPAGRDERFTVAEILCDKGAWHTESDPTPRSWTRDHGSEGWLVQGADSGVLILKYNNRLLEWSLLGPVSTEQRTRLVFGGAGGWHGDPEELAKVGPGESFAFGETVLLPYNGGPRDGLYAFRRFMDAAGHGCPPGFDPPVHWNEIYDNKLWWGVGDSVANRRKYYRLDDMLWEARKAAEGHCEALYLDPGWDTRFGTHVWDADRLLDCAEFCRRLRDSYGLSVSLHTPMAQWQTSGGGGSDFPAETWRMDKNGKRLHGQLCSSSNAYSNEETRRLLALCKAGVRYLMFDGSSPTGPCFDPKHGHPLPPTRSDHARALAVIARKIHQEFPDVIIEQHDQVTAGRPIAYCPHYFLHAPLSEGPRNQTWTERWGYEFMWDPMQDVLSGRAAALYYYNLAYSLPMYLHIDLRPDNEHCLAFWWYASTCRHLGIGGTHPDGHNWPAIRQAMALYRRLEPFFKRGTFFGLGENVHVHALGGHPDYRKPGEQATGLVFVLFNTTRRTVRRNVSFSFLDVGLTGDEEWLHTSRWSGPAEKVKLDAGGGHFSVRLAPMSPAVVEFSPDVGE